MRGAICAGEDSLYYRKRNGFTLLCYEHD